MTKIAFLGLGHMGKPMAINLLKAGHDVCGFDLSTQALDSFKSEGGRSATIIEEATQGVDVVVSMLPSGKEVSAVYLAQGGLIDALSAPCLFIDCSTIDVATSRAVDVAAQAQGFAFVDAPVSGGTAGAAAGTLTFMVGGADAAFAKAEPFLMAMGKTIIHCGSAGAGQAAKICNNAVLGVSMAAISEAFALADKLGLERQKLFDVASRSSGQCWSLTSYCPVPGPVPTSPANRDYAPGFTAAMMLKDMKLAMSAIADLGVKAPTIEKSASLYQGMVDEGQANTDFSGVFKYLNG